MHRHRKAWGGPTEPVGVLRDDSVQSFNLAFHAFLLFSLCTVTCHIYIYIYLLLCHIWNRYWKYTPDHSFLVWHVDAVGRTVASQQVGPLFCWVLALLRLLCAFTLFLCAFSCYRGPLTHAAVYSLNCLWVWMRASQLPNVLSHYVSYQFSRCSTSSPWHVQSMTNSSMRILQRAVTI